MFIDGLVKEANVLNAAARAHIKAKNYGLHGEDYPIENKRHAIDALSRASQNATPAEYHAIERKVHKKYPSMKIKGLND